ncbi:MAG: elongation factor P [Christensenellaceae bacterium]|jgi:elongation factor P|nr:elongation factor P [Christensenellaceae bacterium]
MKSTEFKAGTLFKMDGQFFRVVEGQMIQQPRLAAFMRARIKNIETGAVQDRNFKPSEAYDEVEITKRSMKFSYIDGDLYYFMEEDTFEMEPVAAKFAKDALLYNPEEGEGVVFTFEYADGKLMNIVPPTFVILRVVETEPAVAGDTARNTLKSAKLETGLVVKVQMFINNGDRLKIDTRTGDYVERVR